MSRCADCGNRLYGDICSNCQEELFILEEFGEEIDFPLTQRFMDRVQDQRQEVRKRKKDRKDS